MRLALEAHSDLLSQIPHLSLESLARISRKHVAHRQRFIVKLMMIAYQGLRPHSAWPGYTSFSRDYLMKGLKVSKRKGVLLPFLTPVLWFWERNFGYSRHDGVTKAYALREHVEEALDRVLSSGEAMPIEAAGSRQTSNMDAPALPPSVQQEGIRLDTRIPLSVEAVDQASRQLETWIDQMGYPHADLDPAKPDGLRLNQGIRILRVCRAWAVTNGGLPNWYRLQSHGRLGPAVGDTHIISLPRILRDLLLSRSGWMDFDLASCHWSILLSLAKAHGIEAPFIESYVQDKSGWIDHWDQLIGRDPWGNGKAHLVKPIAASWLTGGRLSDFGETAGAKLAGERVMGLLCRDQRTRNLYQETRETLKQVIKVLHPELWERREREIVNAVARPLRLPEGAPPWGRVYSHVLTGYEQFAIRTICSRAEGVKAIIYDGFIAPPQDTGPLEEAVREMSARSLGVTLDLKIRRTAFPESWPDREKDPWDF